MSVRSRAAVIDAPVQVSKVFGPGVPESFRQGEEAAQMTPASPFGPGAPIGPYDGYDRTPRSREFVTGYNIATRPRTHERVAFGTLKGLIDSYDVARICIRHRIASLRSLDWQLVAEEGYQGDVSAEIAEGKRVLKRPDRKTLFKPWLAKYLRDVLSYDAGTLSKMRNRAGRTVGLKVVSGITIAPLLDYWGDRPEPPAEAYVQYVNGIPFNWLTSDDLIYEPYDPQPDSIYGTAPLEDILLNANTDLRFQLYFLQRFTDGNIPAAFASAPESWSPDQIEQFQELWDAFMAGDQSRKSQIRWLPPGSKIEWSNEKDFTDSFSLFLMRKTCSAYSIVPSDLGFTESVNKSSGESQADVQHRVGDLPMAHHIQDILSSFLQDDLQLPLKFAFDLGEEQDDRVDQATADDKYMKMGVVGPSEIREMRYGLTDPEPIPRFIYTERAGPIPISSLLAVAGTIDPATELPEPGSELPKTVFGGTEGVLPNPPIKVMSLAEREYGESAMPPAPPPQPKMTPADEVQPGQPVAKEGEGATGNITAGITAETGLYSYDLDGQGDEDEDEPASADGVRKRYLTMGEARQAYRDAVAAGTVDPEVVAAVEARMAADREATGTAVAKEMQAFRNFARKRRKAGDWQDFTFRSVAKVRAHNLNDAGRLAVRKDAGEVAVAGLAVLAADTGRVLMLQRGLDDSDPAAGKLEFPGGHLDGQESPLQAAWREFCEETGCPAPPGVQTGSWTSADGIYRGIVWTADSEASVPVRGGAVIPNPDADPDGDSSEAVMWVEPADLADNPMVRAELAASLADVLPLLGCAAVAPVQGDEATCPCGTPVVYDEMNGWQHADGSISHDDGDSVSDKMAAIAKAAVLPKASSQARKAAKAPTWPGWKLDLPAASYWSPKVTAAAQRALSREQLDAIAAAYASDHPDQDGKATGKLDRKAAALAWLRSQGVTVPMDSVAQGIAADSVLIGGASAQAAADGKADADTGDWKPGNAKAAAKAAEALGLGALLSAVTGSGDAGGGEYPDVAGDMEDGYLGVVSQVLAGWDPEVAAEELGGMLADAVADGAYAEALTVTQITVVAGQAALSYYLANTTSAFQWVAVVDARTCVRCLDNANADPRAAGTAWPSGDLAPPAHPGGCRCALVPTWLSTS